MKHYSVDPRQGDTISVGPVRGLGIKPRGSEAEPGVIVPGDYSAPIIHHEIHREPAWARLGYALASEAPPWRARLRQGRDSAFGEHKNAESSLFDG